MRNLKFLFTASRASHIENFHLPAIRRLREMGYTVDTAAQGNVSSKYCDASYNLEFIKNICSPKNFDTIRKLSRILKAGQYDVVVSNTTLASAMTRLAMSAIKKKRPYHIYICHGYLFKDDNSKKARLYRTIEKLTASRVDLLLTMNTEDYEIANRHRLCKNIKFINGMGLLPENFPTVSRNQITEFRSSVGADENDFVFLCVGEFSTRKNQALIINSFSKLLSKYPNALLIFAGEGELLGKIKQLAEYKEISHRIRFLGQVDDTNVMYRSANAVVSASRYEGLPFNIMEALECGTPIVASNIKGHRDLIHDEFNGLLFTDNDEDSLLEKMMQIMNRDMYTSLCQNTYLDKKYTAEAATEDLLRYYLGRFDNVSADAVGTLEDNQ